MIGAAELAAMKPTATLINIARGSGVDQDALVAALNEQQIASAFLDVTTPEPLPADDPLWSLDNAHITMHLSGRAQDKMFVRSAQRFLENLGRWKKGDRKSTRLNSSHYCASRMPSSAWKKKEVHHTGHTELMCRRQTQLG